MASQMKRTAYSAINREAKQRILDVAALLIFTGPGQDRRAPVQRTRHARQVASQLLREYIHVSSGEMPAVMPIAGYR